MSSLSLNLTADILKHVLGGVQYEPRRTYYIGVGVNNYLPDYGGPGNYLFVEPSGGNYARAAIDNNRSSFPDCSTTGLPTKTNGAVINFPEATATWGTVTHWAIFDSQIGGTSNQLASGVIDSGQRSVGVGTRVKIAAGKISIGPIGWTGQYYTSWSGIGGTNPVTGGSSALGAPIARSLLNMVFGGVYHAATPNLYVSIGSIYSLAGATSATYNEIGLYTGYARGVATFSHSTIYDVISYSTQNQMANVGEISLGANTSNLPWQPQHFGIHDQATVGAGNLLFLGELFQTSWVYLNDSVRILAGDLKVKLL